MKKRFLALASLTAGMGILGSLWFAQADYSSNFCDTIGRLKDVCYKMKHMRSQILALEAQRDLMQINYTYLEALGKDIGQVVDQLVNNDNHDRHLDKIEEVGKLAEQLAYEANARNPRALQTSNMLRQSCNECHSPTAPRSGYDWNQVFRTSWDKIVERCNEAGRNPYICKNMHGMVSAYSYFFTAMPADHLSFETIEANATEIRRISRLLQQLGADHGGGLTDLQDVEMRADEIIEMAQAGNPEVQDMSRNIAQSCTKCHK